MRYDKPASRANRAHLDSNSGTCLSTQRITVGDDYLALGHHRGQVAITRPIGDVPTNTELNSFRLKATPPINRFA